MEIEDNKILILSGNEINEILSRDFEQIIEVIQQSYLAHEKGKSSLPYSVFLRFPNAARNRIIGLPAYIEDTFPVAGIKWIASFPDNILHNIDRASAVIILNSTKTGRPYSILEGSIISAKRTAASAALAAQVLVENKRSESLALVGCGLINFEIFKFITSQFRDIKTIYLHDIDSARVEQFSENIKRSGNFVTVVCENLIDILKASKLISFATTSSAPYINDLSSVQQGALLLNISLRDLSAEVVHENINIVDDVNHVNRENTGIHLASQKFGNTDFISATLGELMLNKEVLPSNSRPVIFSPFGLGILDMAVANYAYRKALNENKGLIVSNFFPESGIKK